MKKQSNIYSLVDYKKTPEQALLMFATACSQISAETTRLLFSYSESKTKFNAPYEDYDTEKLKKEIKYSLEWIDEHREVIEDLLETEN